MPDRERFFRSAAMLTAAAVLLSFSKWSLRSHTAQEFVAPLAWIGSTFLVYATLRRVRPNVLRVSLQTLAGVPLLAGLVLATIGFLGLMFIVGDQDVATSGRLTPNLTFETGYHGYVFSKEWAEVRVYRAPRWSPLQHEVYERTFGEDEFQFYNEVSVRNQQGETGCIEISAPKNSGVEYVEHICFQ